MRFYVLIFLALLYAPFAHAEEFNAGIVQGLWYAEENVFAEKPTRIYIAIRNNTGSDLSGTVEFFAGERKIGRKNVEALNGRIIESWTDWTPTYGTSTLKATLTRIELDTVAGETQEVTVVSALAEDEVFADYDTDEDAIGNHTDTDDDNDNITDAQELLDGTDPLVVTKPSAETSDEEVDDDAAEKLEATEDNSAQESATQNTPEGIERYLAESPAEQVLSSVTTFINEAKKDVDTYREKRAEEKVVVTPEAIEVDESGFGNVERASSTQGTIHQIELTDFFASVITLAKAIISSIYTFVLFALSAVLAHPTLIQVGALLLILFLIMKFAAKFGTRPKHKKL
jgi:hypothetical protein